MVLFSLLLFLIFFYFKLQSELSYWSIDTYKHLVLRSFACKIVVWQSTVGETATILCLFKGQGLAGPRFRT